MKGVDGVRVEKKIRKPFISIKVREGIFQLLKSIWKIFSAYAEDHCLSFHTENYEN